MIPVAYSAAIINHIAILPHMPRDNKLSVSVNHFTNHHLYVVCTLCMSASMDLVNPSKKNSAPAERYQCGAGLGRVGVPSCG